MLFCDEIVSTRCGACIGNENYATSAQNKLTMKVAVTLLQINNCLSGMWEHHFDVFQKLSSLEMSNDIKYSVAKPNLPLVLCACTLIWVLEHKLFSLVMWLHLKLCLINRKAERSTASFISRSCVGFLWKFSPLPSQTWFQSQSLISNFP